MHRIKYRLKSGYGSHTVAGVVYVSGSIIEATVDELGGALDKFEPMEPIPDPPQPNAGLKVVSTGDDKYDVVNEASGDALNDESLSLQEATSIAGDVKLLDENGEPMTPEAELAFLAKVALGAAQEKLSNAQETLAAAKSVKEKKVASKELEIAELNYNDAMEAMPDDGQA